MFYRRASRIYLWTFKREVIEYYISHEFTKQYVWEKFTGDKQEHGQILKWMRQLGYNCDTPKRIYYHRDMKTERETKDMDKLESLTESEKVKRLEKQLKEAELKVLAYSKMIDIAEREFKIAIRKKYNTKP